MGMSLVGGKAGALLGLVERQRVTYRDVGGEKRAGEAAMYHWRPVAAMVMPVEEG